MAGNDDEGLVTFLKANTPLNNTERERCQCPAWIQAFFSTEQYLDFFPFLNESTFIPTSLRSLDWKRLFLKNWSPSAESHMFSLADECCLLGWGWCWGYSADGTQNSSSLFLRAVSAPTGRALLQHLLLSPRCWITPKMRWESEAEVFVRTVTSRWVSQPADGRCFYTNYRFAVNNHHILS